MSPLLGKLRCKAGQRVLVEGAPVGVAEQVAAARELERAGARSKEVDVAIAFHTRKHELLRALPRLRDAITEGGILWIGYPKGKALGTDLHRDVIAKLAAARGLQPVAICAVDEIWSALRLKRESATRRRVKAR